MLQVGIEPQTFQSSCKDTNMSVAYLLIYFQYISFQFISSNCKVFCSETK